MTSTQSSAAAAAAAQAKLAYEEAKRRYEEAAALANEATITSESDLARQVDSWRSDPSLCIAPTFGSAHSRLPSDSFDYFFDPGLGGFELDNTSPALQPLATDDEPIERFDLASWSFQPASSAAPMPSAPLSTGAALTAEDLSRLLDQLGTTEPKDNIAPYPTSDPISFGSLSNSEFSSSPQSLLWSPSMNPIDAPFTASSFDYSWPEPAYRASSTYSLDSAPSTVDESCDEDWLPFDILTLPPLQEDITRPRSTSMSTSSSGVSRNTSIRRQNRASPYPTTSPVLRATAAPGDELFSPRLSSLRMTKATSLSPQLSNLSFSLQDEEVPLFQPSDFSLPPPPTSTSTTTAMSTSLPIDIPSRSTKTSLSRKSSKATSERKQPSTPRTRSPPKFSYDATLEFSKNESHRFIVFTQTKEQAEVNEKSVTELYLDPNTPEHLPLWRLVFGHDASASTDSDTSEYTFFGESGSIWRVTYSPSFGPVIVPSSSSGSTTVPTPVYTFIHFAPHTFVVSPSPIGSLAWWRVQACEVKHDLFPGEGFWTARYDAVPGSRRPARIIAHFASCRHRRAEGDKFVMSRFARAVQATL